MRTRLCGNRPRSNGIAVGAGIGAALGAATHAMAECLAIGVAVGALADALVVSRRCNPADASPEAGNDGRPAP